MFHYAIITLETIIDFLVVILSLFSGSDWIPKNLVMPLITITFSLSYGCFKFAGRIGSINSVRKMPLGCYIVPKVKNYIALPISIHYLHRYFQKPKQAEIFH